ncbi:uncharacterized protein LOC129619367 [Condylostylus longicornis]|uniref:uncharacterized protein LOC129619367 n=1 Tax=Condylostylus longicornis TaxID=2530218 RepID=UPI00244E4A52|nr:uncharacterized protein LOC129619367 [Condylostylus longicornis]
MKIHDNKVILVVFLDLQRAFETVNRNILLEKLKKYGIRNMELKWFESYLSNRTQKTKVNNSTSDSLGASIGVPQGSVLGVLLFLIYVNDMAKVVQRSKLVLFADDALLYVCCDAVEECVNIVNDDLNNLCCWSKMNKLKLNINKTKFMLFNSNYNVDILIDSSKIEIAIGRSLPISPCDRTAPIAWFDTSVVSMNGFSKSGNASISDEDFNLL